MKSILNLLLILILSTALLSCKDNNEHLLEDQGNLILSMSIDIEVITTGRTSTIDTDSFKITIFDGEGVEYLVINPFSSAPEKISLPTGEYYVEASSNNEQNAAFEEPFYYGKTDIFTIDKEENKYVEVDMFLANTQVSILWSDNVKSNFTDYSAIVTLINSQESLTFNKDETRSGYFITSPLSVSATLVYTKLDGSIIEKTVSTTIDEPLPKTHYRIKINAVLEDGNIVFKLNVDESVDIIDIDLTDEKISAVWKKTIGGSGGDEIRSINKTTDGGFIMAGSSSTTTFDSGNNGAKDFWVIKTDIEGGIEWQKLFGGSMTDEAFSAKQTTDGGYIIAGESMSNNFDVSGNHGDFDVWVIKLDGSGNLEWEKSLGGSKIDRARSVIQVSDGGFIIAGWSNSEDGDLTENKGNYDIWIVKLNSNGVIGWQVSYGGSSFEEANNVFETTDGGFIIGGTATSSDGDVSASHAGYEMWVLKINNVGVLNWQKTYGGSSTDRLWGMDKCNDGGYILAGQSNSNDGDVTGNLGVNDGWVVKIDSQGNIMWEKSLGGSSTDQFNSVKQTLDGGFILGGHSASADGDLYNNEGTFDYWALKLNAMAEVEWSTSFGGYTNEYIYSVLESSSGEYILAGYTHSDDGDVEGFMGLYDGWLIKLLEN